MAIPFNDLVEEVSTLLATVWPDIVRDGKRHLREVEHIQTIPFDEVASEGFPYCVLVVPEPEPIELGLCNRSYLLNLEAWWVGKTARGVGEQREKAEALASYLRANDLTLGQVWDEPDPRPLWSGRTEVNRMLRELKLPVMAGGVIFSVVVGETDG